MSNRIRETRDPLGPALDKAIRAVAIDARRTHLERVTVSGHDRDARVLELGVVLVLVHDVGETERVPGVEQQK